MKNLRRKKIILIMAAAVLLISILLMAIIIPGVYTNTLPNEYNIGAVIGISLAILIRLLIFLWYILTIKKIRHNINKSKTAYITIGVIMILFGLFYLDGAIAFLDNKDGPLISYLMFTSVFLDLIASILTFIAAFLKPLK